MSDCLLQCNLNFSVYCLNQDLQDWRILRIEWAAPAILEILKS
jgi:hypothetical protein